MTNPFVRLEEVPLLQTTEVAVPRCNSPDPVVVDVVGVVVVVVVVPRVATVEEDSWNFVPDIVVVVVAAGGDGVVATAVEPRNSLQATLGAGNAALHSSREDTLRRGEED